MTNAGMLHLEKLTLRNFRYFEACEVHLERHLTVLTAENGSGKTALLDAIGLSLGLFVDTVSGIPQYPGFERTDVRRARGADGVIPPAVPTELGRFPFGIAPINEN